MRPRFQALAHRPALLAGALFAAASPGCSEEAAGLGEGQTPTAITLDPAAFLGGVPCSSRPGGLQTYVATITDLTESFVLPSSPPTPCSRAASFRYVVPGHEYGAEVDGYTTGLNGEILPFGAGSRQMVVAADPSAVAEPAWGWKCPFVQDARACVGGCPGPAVARDHVNVVFQGCGLVAEPAEPPRLAVEVDPRAALGGLRCVEEGGTVVSFDLRPLDSALAEVLGWPCKAADEALPVVYDQGLVAGASYAFRVVAHDAESAVERGATCTAVADAEVTAAAACTALTANAAVTVDASSLFEQAALACPDAISTYRVSLTREEEPGAEPVQSIPIPCDENVRFDALEPGTYQGKLVAKGPDGAEVLTATCAATAGPGESVEAACSSP